MFNLIKNEFINILSRKKTKILLILEVVIVFISYYLIRNSELISKSNFNFINYILNSSLTTLSAICISIIFTSEIIVLEYSKGTIRQILIRPKSKLEIFLSKLITIILLLIIQYILILIPTLLISYFKLGTLNLHTAIYQFLNQSIVGIIISISLSIMLGIITYSIAISTVVPIAFYCLGQMLSYSVFHSFYKYYIYYYVDYPITMTKQSPLFVSLLVCAYFLVFMFISFFLFSYRDIK